MRHFYCAYRDWSSVTTCRSQTPRHTDSMDILEALMSETGWFSAKMASSVAAVIAAGFYFAMVGIFELTIATLALIAFVVGTALVWWTSSTDAKGPTNTNGE